MDLVNPSAYSDNLCLRPLHPGYARECETEYRRHTAKRRAAYASQLRQNAKEGPYDADFTAKQFIQEY
jgi:hypothetical protein